MKRPPATYNNDGYWKHVEAAKLISPYAYMCMPEAGRQAALTALQDQHMDGRAEMVDKVISAVCQVFGVSRQLLKRKSRQKTIVRPRQVVCFLLLHREETLANISRLFDLDHSTIIYAREAISRRLTTDRKLQEQMVAINIILNGEG